MQNSKRFLLGFVGDVIKSIIGNNFLNFGCWRKFEHTTNITIIKEI